MNPRPPAPWRSRQPEVDPVQGLDRHLVVCTIVSNRAGEKPAGSLTIRMDVVRKLGRDAHVGGGRGI